MARKPPIDDKPDPDELCRMAFSRCSNWPADRAGQIGLAQGVKLAADRYHVAQEFIIARCAETSAYCPTDADVLRVASEIRLEKQRAANAPPAWTVPIKCGACDDTGWVTVKRGNYDCAARCPHGCRVPVSLGAA